MNCSSSTQRGLYDTRLARATMGGSSCSGVRGLKQEQEQEQEQQQHQQQQQQQQAQFSMQQQRTSCMRAAA